MPDRRSDGDLDALEARSCTGKSKYGPVAARNIAASMRIEGQHVQPYRCAFCPSWHVGHVMSWPGVEQLAAVIRDRAYPEGPHIERTAS